ncbi:Mur ligase family protein [Campylobacter mucosalis]|uniref:Mur ligase family protein n=1 Tax=Campylobacter mucosalis TaxID=202 RepID=UPI0014706DDB|nr:UDP-N-acetylmuramoyl-tripeptide--D-alanyl-D-alanine ligase [Campylobacter mucosalis]
MSLFSQEFFNVAAACFVLSLGFYVITCFQWFSYRVERVLFHFTKPAWHVFFFIIPVVLFYTTGRYFFIYFCFAYLPALFLWHKKLDKKLVFTGRIKRFFAILIIALIVQNLLYFIANKPNSDIILPLVMSLVLSHFLEKFNSFKFQQKAKEKLNSIKNLKIIMITASYGKTSIKNFLYEILKDDFVVYKTPRSVNTLVGIIKDINENLDKNTQIYIAEAGARQSGDIAEISSFLNPQIVVVGEIGAQHIEYFKSIENVRATKLEALKSSRLDMAFLHSSTLKEQGGGVEIYDRDLGEISTTLDGLEFKLKNIAFKTPLLGKFNASNLAVCIKVARYLGLSDDKISKKLLHLKNVEHRLERMDAKNKIIIDDSFNGNFAGMSASYELVATYNGRKVLITPGIVESTSDENEKLSRIINEIFDVVMISSALNAQALLKHLHKPQIVIIKDKSKMQELLSEHTRSGDLILFSNDAPSFM